MTTKHPYLKEILKTTAKVALWAGATLAAGAFAFEFGAVYFNAMLAGYIAGGVTLGAGTMATIHSLVKNIKAIPNRIKEQKAQAELDHRFEQVDQRLAQLEKTKEHEQAPKLVVHHRLNPFMRRRHQKQYEDAA